MGKIGKEEKEYNHDTVGKDRTLGSVLRLFSNLWLKLPISPIHCQPINAKCRDLELEIVKSILPYVKI